MPPPSQLAIATSSVNRLLKEEDSYHKELEQEEANVQVLKEKIDSGTGDDDGNAPFMLKQQQTALEQTKAVFGPLREKIAVAIEKLEEQLAVSDQLNVPEEQVQQAKETLAKAKAIQTDA
jgi:tubulin-specific chaperone A